MNLLQKWFGKKIPAAALVPNESQPTTSESGSRANPEDRVRHIYNSMWVDPTLVSAIQEIRRMDRIDGRVKRIHARITRDVIKGGLVFQQSGENDRLTREWKQFSQGLQLNRAEKLKSDARGLVMEGNLPYQWVLDDQRRVVAGLRMPAETIRPNVNINGQFKDLQTAYSQVDLVTGTELAQFPLWQLTVGRMDPDNFDDMGSLGRPFLDASRSTWRKLAMTEEDLVLRRRVRAPLRVAHTLEGASQEEIDAYRKRVEGDQYMVTTDYYLNKKGGVAPVQGDVNLDQIRDVVHLLDSLFNGTPLPKGLMGYTDGLARDILEDLKRDYYDEIDVLQDVLAYVYLTGFRLHLLLQGINPDAYDFTIRFAERRTETLTQTTDRALKLKALGIPEGMVFEELGYNASSVRKRRDYEAAHYDPYPGEEDAEEEPTDPPSVKITPGNGRKGESATSVSNG